MVRTPLHDEGTMPSYGRAYLPRWCLWHKGRGTPYQKSDGGMDPGKQGFPIREDEHPHGHSQMVPEIPFTPQFLSARPVEFVGQFEDLMHEEGKKVQKEEVEGEMLFPMPVVVFDMIALIL